MNKGSEGYRGGLRERTEKVEMFFIILYSQNKK